ncbi:MAG: hypothetical protein ACR2NZ_20105 [Rubripirellula sp.]
MLSVSSQPQQTLKPTWACRLVGGRVSHIGIDIGIDRVKVATLGSPRGRSEPGLQWVAQSEFPLPVDPQKPSPENWLELVVEQLQKRLPRCVFGNQNFAWISIPLPWIHYQTTTRADLESSRSQCDAMFEASLFQSRSHIVHWPIASDTDSLVVAATAHDASLRVAEAIGKIGYDVQGVVPHGVALINAASTLTSLTPTAVLLLEQTGGLITLRNHNSIGLCRSLPALRHSEDGFPTRDVLDPWLREVSSEVNATIRYAARQGDQIDTDSPILLCGEVAHRKGIDNDLATLIGRPVATWRYAGRNRPANQTSIFDPNASDSSMAVSLSLACSGLCELGANR